jgi:hypothetical protein
VSPAGRQNGSGYNTVMHLIVAPTASRWGRPSHAAG